MLDRTTTTNEQNFKSLQFLTKAYIVKKDCEGGNVKTVVELFKSVYKNMASLKDMEFYLTTPPRIPFTYSQLPV